MSEKADLEVMNETVTELESKVIEVFVNGAKVVGLPRSLGEIYGLLYITAEPMSMEQIVQKLNISIGSASQGLKQLKSMRAVKSSYKAGERKDYYAAEVQLRKLVANLLREEILPQLEGTHDSIQELSTLVSRYPDEEREHYQGRVDSLLRWQKYSSHLLKRLTKFILR